MSGAGDTFALAQASLGSHQNNVNHPIMLLKLYLTSMPGAEFVENDGIQGVFVPLKFNAEYRKGRSGAPIAVATFKTTRKLKHEGNCYAMEIVPPKGDVEDYILHGGTYRNSSTRMGYVIMSPGSIKKPGDDIWAIIDRTENL